MTEHSSHKRDLVISIHRELTPAQRADFDQLETRCFTNPQQTPEERWRNADRYSSAADTIGYTLAYSGTVLVGAVQLFERVLPFGGRTVRLGGLGGVATDPDWRGQGIAAATTAAAMAELRRAGSEVAYLCALPEVGQRLYRKVGFVPLGRPYTYRGASGTQYTDHNGWLAPLNDPALFAALLADMATLDLAGSNW